VSGVPPVTPSTGESRVARSHTVTRTPTMARRRRAGSAMTVVVWCAALLCLLPLLFILGHLVVGGARVLSPSFFTALPAPPGERGGGVANGIAGTLVLLTLASAIGLPIGLGAGLYLAEHGRTRLASVVRYLSDVLSGMPSIVLGVFAWELVVRRSGQFSAFSGGLALGAIMIPIVTRATEEMVRLVPPSLREAALALGFSRWRSSITIVLRTALPGIATAALVAVARVAGETAPLLFTAFGTPFWSLRLDRPIAALPLQIYNYATSPYDDWRAQAWGGALVLIALVVVISLLARRVTRSRFGTSGGGATDA
jgi:phosphate transport system permease protein